MPDIKKKRSWIMWTIKIRNVPSELYTLRKYATYDKKKLRIIGIIKKVKVTEL